jgi:integrase
VFDYAVTRELIDGNPVPPLRAFDLDAHDVNHHGTIDPERLPDLWRHVEASGATVEAKAAILLAMTTAHRVSVVTHAEWDHIDVNTRVWTVPRRSDKTTRGRMKSGRAHAIRLPASLLDRLQAIRRDDEQRWLFPSPVRAKPISEAALVKTLKTFDKSLTAHGFRNAAKIFARRAGVPDYVADALVDHAPQGLDRAYRRDEGLPDAVADLVEKLLEHVTREA